MIIKQGQKKKKKKKKKGIKASAHNISNSLDVILWVAWPQRKEQTGGKKKKITADTFVLEAMATEQLERKKSIKKIIELVTYVITRFHTPAQSILYTNVSEVNHRR